MAKRKCGKGRCGSEAKAKPALQGCDRRGQKLTTAPSLSSPCVPYQARLVLEPLLDLSQGRPSIKCISWRRFSAALSMFPMDSLYLWVALVFALLAYCIPSLRRSSNLPPGPKPITIIGNVHQMPKEREWFTFAKWAELYGDCIYVHVLGQPIVILSSFKVANELLSKRSAIYSSRHRLVMAGELGLGLTPYSARFHAMRRLLHKELTGNALRKYEPLHEQESRSLVKTVLEDPLRFRDAVRHYAGSIIMKMTYGYQTEPRDDHYLLLAEKVLAAFSQASQPGAWLVDIMPWIRHLPDWFPGTNFKRIAAHWSRLHLEFIEGPYYWAKAHQDSPSMAKPNFISTILAQDDNVSGEAERVLLDTAGSLFGGGSDTTVAAITSFFLAMSLYPDIQRRGQEEVDRVIGGKRLPKGSDRTSLPYVEYIMREILRWRPVANLGLPHVLTRDDNYNGYHIPAGTFVIPNIWLMLHDPVVFPSPEEFNPDRFIGNQAAVDAVAVAFGFGRRFCPGINFAESSMFVAIATLLATCNITNAMDENGNHLHPDVVYRTGTISHPPPFTCAIKPRNENSLVLLEDGD